MTPALPHRNELPVEVVLPDVIAALAATRTAVLVAPTGAGKTTRLPGALVEAGLGPVVVLEPRRLAARAAARRVAAERGVQLGREVGYHVRFDNKVGPRTEIAFVTQGIFLARLQSDPFLEGVGTVVLDEFHERSLDLDLALALVRRVQVEARDDLALVVTSATLDAPAISAYLDDAPIVRSEGRLFPVALEHLPREARERPEEHVVRGIRRALEAGPGDVLAFLAGKGEIRRTRERLERASRDLVVMELHGELSAEQQDAVLSPAPRRKVVLATNLAESSVTVPGVASVVDSGEARVMQHDPATGLDRLELTRISLASAEQRRGRAGREMPGLAVRLWSPLEERALPAFDEPEIRRADLAGAALQLLAWGERDLAAFPWFEPPTVAALERALALLRVLGAVDAGGLTELGRLLARVPAQPRLARLLVAGHEFGVPAGAAAAAAILGERDPWRYEDRRVEQHGSDSDVLDRVRALLAFERDGNSPDLERGAAHACLAAKRQLERIARAALGEPRKLTGDASDALLIALLAAFPDRLTRRRVDDPTRGVLVGGRGVHLAPECAVREGELFLSIDLDGLGGEARVRKASLVQREWVDGGRTHAVFEPVFDAARQRVAGRKRVYLGELLLEETDAPLSDARRAEQVLVDAARADLERALGLADPERRGFLARVRSLAEWMPELELPTIDDAWLAELLPELAVGATSFADLRAATLEHAVLARLDHRQRAALEREAPERWQVPSGSRIRLTYEPGRPPVLAARIQELFGLRETPRVAAGRIPVLLHLLAPNGRPQQVTDDLASFWSDTYFRVRKDLRPRYPKHSWPDDPTTAPPQRRPRRRH